MKNSSDKPYSPLLLANGVDSMLIDWGGNMRCCDKGLEHFDRYWFKSDRRRPDESLYPVCFSGTMFVVNGEQHLVREFKQEFDPVRAILRSKIEAAGIRADIVTFLTRNHLLIQRVKITATPTKAEDVAFELLISRPEKSLNDAHWTFAVQKEMITANYQADKTAGECFIWSDHHSQRAETGSEIGRLSFDGGKLVLSELDRGSEFTLAVFAGDDHDEPGARESALASLAEGYRTLYRNHTREWLRYAAQSSVELPSEELNALYRMSAWRIRSYQHPVQGGLPTGMLPVLWQGKIFWDSYFMQSALLESNHVVEGRAAAEFWLKTATQARRNARELGYPGARFGWCTDQQGVCGHLKEIREFHNNPVAVCAMFEYYRRTGDRQALAAFLPVMRDAMDFMIAAVVRETGSEAVIDCCEGVDESLRRQYTNDTWTCAATLAGLQALVESAAILSEPIDKRYAVLAGKLAKGLLSNRDHSGVLKSARGAVGTNFGCMVNLLLPDFPGRATMDHLWRNRGEFSSPARCGFPRQDARDVPWFSAWAATMWAQYGSPVRSMEYLRNCLRYANDFRQLPEQIRPDSSLYKEGMGTAHGAFMMALHHMLLQMDSGILKIAPCVPAEWQDFSFKNLRVSPGILVSAGFRDGRCSSLKLVNTTPDELNFTLAVNSSRRKIRLPGKAELTVFH